MKPPFWLEQMVPLAEIDSCKINVGKKDALFMANKIIFIHFLHLFISFDLHHFSIQKATVSPVALMSRVRNHLHLPFFLGVNKWYNLYSVMIIKNDILNKPDSEGKHQCSNNSIKNQAGCNSGIYFRPLHT